MGREERIMIAIFGIIVAGIAAWLANYYFTEHGVRPDLEGGYALVVFLAVLGAFGLIAVRAKL